MLFFYLFTCINTSYDDGNLIYITVINEFKNLYCINIDNTMVFGNLEDLAISVVFSSHNTDNLTDGFCIKHKILLGDDATVMLQKILKGIKENLEAKGPYVTIKVYLKISTDHKRDLSSIVVNPDVMNDLFKKLEELKKTDIELKIVYEFDYLIKKNYDTESNFIITKDYYVYEHKQIIDKVDTRMYIPFEKNIIIKYLSDKIDLKGYINCDVLTKKDFISFLFSIISTKKENKNYTKKQDRDTNYLSKYQYDELCSFLNVVKCTDCVHIEHFDRNSRKASDISGKYIIRKKDKHPEPILTTSEQCMALTSKIVDASNKQHYIINSLYTKQPQEILRINQLMKKINYINDRQTLALNISAAPLAECFKKEDIIKITDLLHEFERYAFLQFECYNTVAGTESRGRKYVTGQNYLELFNDIFQLEIQEISEDFLNPTEFEKLIHLCSTAYFANIDCDIFEVYSLIQTLPDQVLDILISQILNGPLNINRYVFIYLLQTNGLLSHKIGNERVIDELDACKEQVVFADYVHGRKGTFEYIMNLGSNKIIGYEFKSQHKYIYLFLVKTLAEAYTKRFNMRKVDSFFYILDIIKFPKDLSFLYDIFLRLFTTRSCYTSIGLGFVKQNAELQIMINDLIYTYITDEYHMTELITNDVVGECS